ncbi:hypothetical protein CR513_13655, partial [Mucuna pruriens]
TKDLGSLKYLLGIEVAQSSSSITISQQKYALDIPTLILMASFFQGYMISWRNKKNNIVAISIFVFYVDYICNKLGSYDMRVYKSLIVSRIGYIRNKFGSYDIYSLVTMVVGWWLGREEGVSDKEKEREKGEEREEGEEIVVAEMLEVAVAEGGEERVSERYKREGDECLNKKEWEKKER